jgi:hypothetical protein
MLLFLKPYSIYYPDYENLNEIFFLLKTLIELEFDFLRNRNLFKKIFFFIKLKFKYI